MRTSHALTSSSPEEAIAASVDVQLLVQLRGARLALPEMGVSKVECFRVGLRH
jgi:hypothetical protein